MTSVEVQAPPSPPGDTSSPVPAGEGGPSSTYEWLASVPVLSSAGSTVYNWYEGSKNYTRASKYALDSVESSVKYVADTAASVAKRPSMCNTYMYCTCIQCSFSFIQPSFSVMYIGHAYNTQYIMFLLCRSVYNVCVYTIAALPSI